MKDYCISRQRARALAFAGLAGLAGCAEMTFKAGAGPGDFAAAEQACQAAGEHGEGYEACMNARGFQVHRRTESVFVGTDAPTSVATAEPSPAPGTAVAEAPGATATDTPAALPRKPSPPAPTGPVRVSSWWKFGGTAGEFAAARAACLVELKESPAAQADEQVASPALVACLRRAGWVGIAAKR